MVTLIKGNLLTSDCDLICHGANCFNTMGAGIARQIAKQYPAAIQADLLAGRPGSYSKLGTISTAYQHNKWIANLYTQYRPGRNFDPRALAGALAQLELWLQRTNIKKVGFPAIGCGIGGGDWSKVKLQLDDFANRVDQEVVVYFL